MPSALAPRRSLWRAILFLSLHVICMTGSIPSLMMITALAMLESLTTAVWLSVRLNASAYPLSIFAWCVSGSGLADWGGPISAVTANLPDSKTFSRLLPVFI